MIFPRTRQCGEHDRDRHMAFCPTITECSKKIWCKVVKQVRLSTVAARCIWVPASASALHYSRQGHRAIWGTSQRSVWERLALRTFSGIQSSGLLLPVAHASHRRLWIDRDIQGVAARKNRPACELIQDSCLGPPKQK
jgi:hypothetical protein